MISHRGNIEGPEPEKENSPSSVDLAVAMGFDVEIDLRVNGSGEIGLGHDELQYRIEANWLHDRKAKLWVHCKTPDAIDLSHELGLNYFFHHSDKYTLTSQGFVWVFPGERPVGKSVVLDVDHFPRLDTADLGETWGVCTDWPNDLKFLMGTKY